MSTNDRPETLTPAELREQSESWRRAALAWQGWAADLLASHGKQPKGGAHGDDAARAAIEALMKRGRTAPSLALEVAALAYAAALCSLASVRSAILDAPRKPGAPRINRLATPRARARLEPLTVAVEKAQRALGRAAVALWKAERRRGTARG